MAATCRPIIEQCRHGRFKAGCECGWRVHPRFTSAQAAERAWASHAATAAQGSDG